jgi:hypothetical protein
MSRKELINKKIKKTKIEIGDQIKLDSKTIKKDSNDCITLNLLVLFFM